MLPEEVEDPDTSAADESSNGDTGQIEGSQSPPQEPSMSGEEAGPTQGAEEDPGEEEEDLTVSTEKMSLEEDVPKEESVDPSPGGTKIMFNFNHKM